jgi:hypothetical protein
LEFKLAAEEGTGYELELVKLETLASLDEYAARGIDYFVVRPVYFTKSRRAVPRAIRLLEQLRSDPRVELLRRFEPESHLQPGPVVEIYRLQSTERPGPA